MAGMAARASLFWIAAAAAAPPAAPAAAAAAAIVRLDCSSSRIYPDGGL